MCLPQPQFASYTLSKRHDRGNSLRLATDIKLLLLPITLLAIFLPPMLIRSLETTSAFCLDLFPISGAAEGLECLYGGRAKGGCSPPYLTCKLELFTGLQPYTASCVSKTKEYRF